MMPMTRLILENNVDILIQFRHELFSNNMHV